MEQRNGFNSEEEETMKKQGREEEQATRVAEYIGQSNKEEQHKIICMRDFVEKHDPSSKEVDNSMLRRFLRARDQDIDKASAMFLKYLTWKRSFVPKGYISEQEIPNEIAQSKQFMQGSDKQGRPITVVLGSKHFYNKKGGVDELKRMLIHSLKPFLTRHLLSYSLVKVEFTYRVVLKFEPGIITGFVVFAFDKLCSSMQAGQEKFVVIADLKGWGYSNSDIRGMLGALSILQDYYPERLGKLFIVHVPYIFMKVWKIVYQFIDNNTKKKIVFVEKKRLKETLLEDIAESQLPEIYGGNLPLIPIQDC